MSRVGEKIKSARLSKGMSLKEISKKCGVSESYIGDIESGKKVVNDSMLKKISSVLGVDFNESIYTDIDDNKEQAVEVKKTTSIKASPAPVSSEWESAFSNIIKDIPVYDMSMKRVLNVKHFPLTDRKIEGYNPDKLVFIKVEDNSLGNYRVRTGDAVMVVLNNEVPANALVLLEYDGYRVFRHIKKLDGENVLLIYYDGGIRTDTRSIREIKVLGRCIRAEIDLTNI